MSRRRKWWFFTKKTGVVPGPPSDLYWRGTVSTDWHTDENWSLSPGGPPDGWVPRNVDNVFFAQAGPNCTINANAECASLTTTDAWDTFGVVASYPIAIVGDVSVAKGTVQCNAATSWAGGNIWSGGGVLFANATFELRGVGKTLSSTGGAIGYGNFTIPAGASYTATTTAGLLGSYIVHGTLEFTTGETSTGLQVGATGEVKGAGGTVSSTLNSVATGGWMHHAWMRLTTFLGGATGTLAGGEFDTEIRVNINSSSSRYTRNTGTNVLKKALVFTKAGTGTYTWDNSVNNPSYVFQGDISISVTGGTFAWTKGTGTVTINGAADQSIDFEQKVIEDLIVAKTAGTATLVSNVTTDSFTIQNTGGSFADGGKYISVAGNIDIQAAAGKFISTGNMNLTVSATISNPSYTSPLTTNRLNAFRLEPGVVATLGNHFYARTYTLANNCRITYPTSAYEMRTWRGEDDSNLKFVLMDSTSLLDCNVLFYTPRIQNGDVTIDQGYIKTGTGRQLRIGYGWGRCVVRMTSSWYIGGQLWVQASYYAVGDTFDKVQILDCNSQSLEVVGDVRIGYDVSSYTGYRGEIWFGDGGHLLWGSLLTDYAGYNNTSGLYDLGTSSITLLGSITINPGYDVANTDSYLTLQSTTANRTITAQDNNRFGYVEVVANPPYRYTLLTDFHCTMFMLTQSDFDLAGHVLYVEDDFRVFQWARFWNGTDSDMQNGRIEYGDDLNMRGESGDQLLITNLDFHNTMDDTSYVEYCTVTNSQRTGPSWKWNINAYTGPGNVDNGGNVGWDFVAPTIYPAEHVHNIYGRQSYYYPLPGQSQRVYKLTGLPSRIVGLPGSREEPYAVPGIVQDPLTLQKTE